MKPSFSGNARPKRQVNLSGRNNNPFATYSSPGNSPSSHAQNTALANAQQERLQRQRERERPPAAIRIQRVWRGHIGRTKARSSWRQLWDDRESEDIGIHPLDPESMVVEDRWVFSEHHLLILQTLYHYLIMSTRIHAGCFPLLLEK